MGREAKFRKTLSMPGLLAQMRRCFEGVEDEVAGRGLSLADGLMSGLAIFSLKYPSLLQFEQDARGVGESAHEPRRENLRSLFRAALARKKRAKYFWEDLRALFMSYRLPDWETLYRALAFGHHVPVAHDTSQARRRAASRS